MLDDLINFIKVSDKHVDLTLKKSSCGIKLSIKENLIIIKNFVDSDIIIESNDFLNFFKNIPKYQPDSKGASIIKIKKYLNDIANVKHVGKFLNVKKQKIEISFKLFNYMFNNPDLLKFNDKFRLTVFNKINELYLEVEGQDKSKMMFYHLLLQHFIHSEKITINKVNPYKLDKMNSDFSKESLIDFILDNYK